MVPCATKSPGLPPRSCTPRRRGPRVSIVRFAILAFDPGDTVTAPPIPPDPFSPLEEATLRAIAETGVVRTFPKNTVLIHEGDSGDALYIVLSGRVKVYASNAQGREFAIAFHGATFVPITLLGAWSLARTPVALSDLRQARS